MLLLFHSISVDFLILLFWTNKHQIHTITENSVSSWLSCRHIWQLPFMLNRFLWSRSSNYFKFKSDFELEIQAVFLVFANLTVRVSNPLIIQQIISVLLSGFLPTQSWFFNRELAFFNKSWAGHEKHPMRFRKPELLQ